MSARRQDRFVSFLSDMLLILSSVALLAMMCLTVTDVFARYVFVLPIPSAVELTELLMVATVFFALPVVTVSGGHVAVDLIDVVVGAKIARAFVRASYVGLAVAFAVLSWRLTEKATGLAAFGDTTQVLRLPVYPFVYLMAGLVAISAISALAYVAFYRDEAEE